MRVRHTERDTADPEGRPAGADPGPWRAGAERPWCESTQAGSEGSGADRKPQGLARPPSLTGHHTCTTRGTTAPQGAQLHHKERNCTTRGTTTPQGAQLHHKGHNYTTKSTTTPQGTQLQ